MSFPGLPQPPAGGDNGAPWWLKYGARGAGCGGGISKFLKKSMKVKYGFAKLV